MSIRATLKVKRDDKVWKSMRRRMMQGANKSVRVGWWNSQHPSGVPTAQIAAWNEHGHINGGMFAGTYTPARPFIRMGFIPESKQILKQHAMMFKHILEGTSSWTAVNTSLKEKSRMLMQTTILGWSDPPNSAVTVALKGFNDPLIETGNLYDSVKAVLVNASGRG